MPKRQFGDMLGNLEPTLAAVPDAQAEESQAASPPDETPAEAPARRPRRAAPVARSRKSATSPTADAGGVGYDKLERKDTRLHERQVAELTALAPRLNRQRQGEGHRPTENTLIRLGVDLLLPRSGDLAGTTESELAASLGLK